MRYSYSRHRGGHADLRSLMRTDTRIAMGTLEPDPGNTGVGRGSGNANIPEPMVGHVADRFNRVRYRAHDCRGTGTIGPDYRYGGLAGADSIGNTREHHDYRRRHHL